MSSLCVGEPDPKNNTRDAELEFRIGVPTAQQVAACMWWDTTGAASIKFKNADQRPVVWRMAGDRYWQYADCPQPLKPHGMTWQEMDKKIATIADPQKPGARSEVG